jgi:phosphate-selective porin OprO/OprP
MKTTAWPQRLSRFAFRIALALIVLGSPFAVHRASAQAGAPPGPAAAMTESDPQPTVAAALGKGVTITSADDKFSIGLRVRAQLRAEALETPDDDQGPVARMFVRRMRLALKGKAGSDALTYAVQFSFAPLDQEPDQYNPLRDAYVNWAAHRDLELRFGQMKIPYGKQRVISSSSLTFPDRTVATGELNLDRDVGLQIHSSDLFGFGHRLGYHLGVFGGDGRNRVATRSGVLAAARLVFAPFGKFDDLVESDIERGDKPRLSLAVSGAFNENSNRPRSTTGTPYTAGDFDYLHGGGDVMFKWHGFYLLTEAFYRHTKAKAVTGTVDGAPVTEFSRSAWGSFVQASQMLTAHAELATRYSYIKPIDSADPSFRVTHEVGIGASYYFSAHDLKLQAEYANVGHELFGDPNRHELRLQFQLFL